MADIVISEFMDEDAVAGLAAEFDTLYDPELVDDPERLAATLETARALIVRNRTQVRGELLAAAPALTVVGRLGVGLDNIDVAACEARGIAVHPATGANDLSVAEYVVATAMMLLRGAFQANAAMIAGKWPRNALMGCEAAGKSIGLIGVGRIARETARLAGGLGMTVIGADPHVPAGDDIWRTVGRRDLAALLAEADAVSLHVPLTDETRGLIGADALARMRPGAILINAARGGIVDEAALAAALREGRLAGAALDTFAEEPLSADRAAIFVGVPNLVLTPHIAGVTVEANVRVSRMIADLIAKSLGTPE
jgi:(S)-sulfolactate dehydrogenase